MSGKKGMKQQRIKKRVVLTNFKTGADIGYGWGIYVVPEEEGGGYAIEKTLPNRRPEYGSKVPVPPNDVIELAESIMVTLSLRGALKPMTVRNV